METKDLNSIGLAYLEMVEKKNTEAKKNHAKTLDKVDPEELEGDHEDRDDKDIDNDGDEDSSDEYLHNKRKAVKKAINKKDDGDDQDKFKAYTGDDKNDQEGTKVSEDKEDKFEPHMMYDPKTGKGYKAEKEEDHLRMKKMGYTHDKPEEIDESTDLQEGAARQAAFHKGLMDYCKEIGKDHMDHKDFADHAKHVKAGNWDQARDHADELDTEPREKIHSLAIDHLGQGAASELYGGDRVSLSKKEGDGKLHASYNESVNVDDVLALIDQGYTLDQAEAMVAEACGGGGGTGGTTMVSSRKYPDDKKLLKASRKQPKAGDNDRNMANDQRSIPAKGADTAPVRPGTKQQQRDFDKAARMAKSKDKVSVAKAPWESVEVDEGYGSMVSPKDRARIKARVDANIKLSPGQEKIAKQTPPRDKITKDDLEHLRTQGHANSPKKESVMDRVSNMVEDIRVDIQEDRVPWNDGSGSYYMSYLDRGHAAINRQLKLGPGGPYKNAQQRINNHNPDPNHPDHDKNIAAMIKDLEKPSNEAVEVDEVSKKTLSSYAKKAMDDVDTQSRFATEYEKRGMAAKNPGVMDKNFKKSNRASDKASNRKAGIKKAIDKMAKEGAGDINNPMKGMPRGGWQGSGPAEPMRVKTMDPEKEKELRAAGKLSNSANNASHYAGESVQEVAGKKVFIPTDRKSLQRYRFSSEYEKRGMKYPYDGDDKNSKKAARAEIQKIRNSENRKKAKSVQEAAKPTAIHHSTPVTAAQANDEQAAGRWTDKAGPNTMTEKEFVDMHTIHPDVLPEFDGNVAAKKTAEAIKKAPKVSPTPNKNPTAGDKNKVKSTEAPAANAGVVGESYMDKYAKYIRGEI